ncbi:hypothetical protein MMC18_006620 [Xylographa bjoerkii]|nr:hypothetical protein [Xylographa bjoerkii]
MTVAIASLVMKCASIVKAAQDVRGRYKAATLTISSMATECVTVSTALSHLQNLAINDNGSVDVDVVNTLETVVIGCTLTISVLDEYILELTTDKSVLKSADSSSKWTTKVKVLWNEAEMRELLQQLRGYQSSITLLLTVLQSEMTIDSKSQVETQDLLRRNHGSLKMMISRARSSRAKKTASIIEGPSIDLLDSQSVLSFPESSRSSISFEFDDLVVNSKVYRQAMLRSIQRNALGDERNSIVELDPVSTGINVKPSGTGDTLAPTARKPDLDPLPHESIIELSDQNLGSNSLGRAEDFKLCPPNPPFFLQPLQLPEMTLLDAETIERFVSFRPTETAPGLPDILIQHDKHSSRQLLPLPRVEPPYEDASCETQPSLVPARSNLPRSTRMCRVCRSPTKGEFVKALGYSYDIECFRCRVSTKSSYVPQLSWTYLKIQDCDQQLTGKFFSVDEKHGTGQYPLCETDYFRRLDLLCYHCGRALRGSYLTACDRKYHVEHLMCSMCDLFFGPGIDYYEHEQKVLCHYHYATQGAEYCTGCKTPIMKQFIEISQTGIKEYWHNECYMLNKFWKIKLATSKDPCWEPSSFIVTKQSQAELRNKGAIMKEKATSTWSILTNFQDTAVEVINSIRTDDTSEDKIRKTQQVIDMVTVLLTLTFRCDREMTYRISQGLYYSPTAKLLCRKVFGILSWLTEDETIKTPASGIAPFRIPQPFLMTGFVGHLKTLIKKNVQGALKLESDDDNSYGLSVLLNGLQGPPAGPFVFEQPDLASADLCRYCNALLEGECARFQDQRWHLKCLQCNICQTLLGENLANARLCAGGLTRCVSHGTLNAKAGFVKEHDLQQAIFLLRIAHARAAKAILTSEERQLETGKSTLISGHITNHQDLDTGR